MTPRSVYMHVNPIGLPDSVTFDGRADFTGCKLCGQVFQSELDRKVLAGIATPQEQVQAVLARKNWSNAHADTHPGREHAALAASGRFCTPEAAYKLAAFGIVSVSDNIFSEEHESAQKEAPRLMKDDVEGMTKNAVL